MQVDGYRFIGVSVFIRVIVTRFGLILVIFVPEKPECMQFFSDTLLFQNIQKRLWPGHLRFHP